MSFSLESNFTTATIFPWKLVKCKEAIVDGKIVPYHLFFCPTNRCNANCRWCGCKNVDRKQELPLEECFRIFSYFRSLGTKAVTITGGGEPTLMKGFDSLLSFGHDLGLKFGLVTNGILWNKGNDILEANKYLTWSRISVTDTESENYNFSILENVPRRLPGVDIGISFVVTKNVNIESAKKVSEIAEKTKNITHARFVDDYIGGIGDKMKLVIESCEKISNKLIFQERINLEKGEKECFESRLRPFLAPDGLIYPCGCVQIALGLEENFLCFPHQFSMGHWSKFDQAPIFDGSKCSKCFYSNYNKTLKKLMNPMIHEEFI